MNPEESSVGLSTLGLGIRQSQPMAITWFAALDYAKRSQETNFLLRDFMGEPHLSSHSAIDVLAVPSLTSRMILPPLVSQRLGHEMLEVITLRSQGLRNQSLMNPWISHEDFIFWDKLYCVIQD